MADTTDYMIMGYAAAFLILAITIGSVWLRYQQAYRKAALIERLAQEDIMAQAAAGKDSAPITSTQLATE